MKKPVNYILGLLFLCLSFTEASAIKNPFDALMIRAGYGGTYIYVSSPIYPFVAIIDNFNLGVDFQTPKGIDLSLKYSSPGLFQSRNFHQVIINTYNLNLNFRPLKQWYNQPYFGAGLTYIDYFFNEYGRINDGTTLNFNINAGLNIQFPNNFYLIADVKKVFGDYRNNPMHITSTLFLSGSLGYRIHKSTPSEEVN